MGVDNMGDIYWEEIVAACLPLVAIQGDQAP
jgi:hypothetical protein